MDNFNSHSTRANSRGSFGSQQPSALSALFGSEMKMSVDAAEFLARKEEEIEEKSRPSSCSYRESYTYAAPTGTSYQYTSNSFYQSYGDSYESLPKSLLGKADIEGAKGNEGAKPLVSVKELLTLILEDATYKQEEDDSNISSSLDGRLVLNGEVDVHTKIESLQLLPAEEDGSPMEDLPDCTAQSDILNMGVRDFIILDKISKLQLIHIRIEGNLTPNDPFEGVLPHNNQIQLVSEDHPRLLQREESLQSIDNLYYTLDDEPENADTIEFFRTDTDEIKHVELQKTVNELQLNQEKTDRKLSKSHRHRSSSGNLIISYRRPNSQRWRVAKKLAVLSENALAEHTSRPTSTDRKSEIAQEVRKKLFESKAVPIPDPHNPNRRSTTSYVLDEPIQQTEGLDRRHSERPYDEERDGDGGDFERFKYSRKASTTSSRSSSFMDLNPHTSISLSAQFSPAGSEVQSSRDHNDSDDDQLGLIQLERANYILAPSSSAYAGRSFGRDESTSAHPFKSSGHNQHRHHASASRTRIGSFTHVDAPESLSSPRHRPRGSGTSNNSSKNNINIMSQMNAKSILSMSDSESDSDSSVEEDRFPIRQLHVNTDFKAVNTTNYANSGGQNYSRKSPSRLNPFRSPGYERDVGDTNSDNGSTRSSVTSSKSVLSRLYDLFGSSSKRRPSFASESNDSVNSAPVTPHQRRSEIGSETMERPSLLLSQQISLPIVQNLDTGDVFPIGALRYEAFKLPETVSPTVLFGTPSGKIHR